MRFAFPNKMPLSGLTTSDAADFRAAREKAFLRSILGLLIGKPRKLMAWDEVALSMYLSSLNNRLSEVMKVIAVVSALALPGTLITGVFGTNFDNVPGLHSNWGFALMMTGIFGAAGSMAWFFLRRGWF